MYINKNKDFDHHQFWVYNDISKTTGGYVVPDVVQVEDYVYDPRNWGQNSRTSQRILVRKRFARSARKDTPYDRPTASKSKKSSPSRSPSPEPECMDLRMVLPEETLKKFRPPSGTDGYRCLNCGQGVSARRCSINCFRKFYRQHLEPVTEEGVMIVNTPNMGAGVFTRPGYHIPKGKYLGIYVGEIRPHDAALPENKNGDYAFELVNREDLKNENDQILVDGASHGNWTRFFNSHCNPNVESLPEQIGKIMVVIFRAKKDIPPNTQLFISYGREYFEDGNKLCYCSARKNPHLPPPVRIR